MYIASISTGFIEVPGKISLNIFTQGCSVRCKQCQNEHLQPFLKKEDINTDKFEQILLDKELPTWICWLGGEPTDQPEEFIRFNKIIIKNNYKICLYTGKLFENIKNLLENVDLVIDGPWEGKLVSDSNTNQRIFYRTNNGWKQYKWNELKGVIC